VPFFSPPNMPLRLLAATVGSAALWAPTAVSGMEKVVSAPTAGNPCPYYSPSCGNTWTGTASVGDTCYVACNTNSGDNPPTRWCPTTSDTSGNDGTPWGWCAEDPPSPGPTPPPPAPPPAPRRCFERGVQNLRLSGTESFGGGNPKTPFPAQFATAASKYVSEGATGNWAAHSITTVAPAAPGYPNLFTKVMYHAASKRTFDILGNVSSNGTVVLTDCDSVPGEDVAKMMRSQLAMGMIFNPQIFGNFGPCTVGEGGLFPFALEPQRLGFVSFGAYGASPELLPGSRGALPGQVSRLLVDESSREDLFIPVSIDLTYISSDLDGGFMGYSFLYSDWASDDTPIPEEEWDIPSVCFSRSDPSTKVWREAPPSPPGSNRSWEWWK
jgi:hypothetical protein